MRWVYGLGTKWVCYVHLKNPYLKKKPPKSVVLSPQSAQLCV